MHINGSQKKKNQFIYGFETLHKLNPRVSRLYNGVSVSSNTCLTIPVHRPYALDIKVIVLSFSYLLYVEFTLYGLTID